jgi:uncharacterized protein
MITRSTSGGRPSGLPLMHMRWGSLLFLHWPCPPEALRGRIPRGLELDLYDGNAWLGVTPFTMWGIRPTFLPAVPVLSASHELNVRTYVRRDGVPGVWFFSLDASNALAVPAARVAYGLPYFRARMTLEQSGDEFRFSSRRSGADPPVELRAAWRRGDPVSPAKPGSRDFFLLERYALYASHRGHLVRARIHHEPWPLSEAHLESLHSSMLAAQGLPQPDVAPIAHAQRRPLEVQVWRPEVVGT